MARILRWLHWVVPPDRPLRWAAPLFVLLGLALLQWRVPGWSARAEGWTIDARFALRGPEPPQSPIVIVAIDEASVQMLGDLHGENVRTWPRARWAALVERLSALGPRLIALDVVFDTPGWDAGGDAALAEAMVRAGNVVLPANLEEAPGDAFRMATYSPPVAQLSSAARATGISTFRSDVDGAIRRLTPLFPWSAQPQPAFALVVASLYRGAPIDVPARALGADLTLPLHFRGPEGTFYTVPLHEVWLGEIDAEAFRDAIVLVGFTTQLEQDRHLTPFAARSLMPGVEVHANAIDTLLAGDWLRRSPDWLVPVLLVGLGLASLGAANLGRPALGLLLLVATALVYGAVAVALFAGARCLVPMVAPLVSLVAVGGTAIAERVVFAEREKRVMRQRFAGIVSPERLKAVMQHWDALRSPQRLPREAAVLFADIRGFTAATETLMGQGRLAEMAEFLSSYLDAMSAAVFAEGGVVYRMLGDGLLILFGLPESLDDAPLCAVRAAVRMARAVPPLTKVWPLQATHPLGLGIGLNFGLMLDAVVGRGRQLDYSVIGDVVNTAARIESHCKQVMAVPLPVGEWQVPETTTVLLGADLFEKVRDHVQVDAEIPPFEARGKADPVRVVRLLSVDADVAAVKADKEG